MLLMVISDVSPSNCKTTSKCSVPFLCMYVRTHLSDLGHGWLLLLMMPYIIVFWESRFVQDTVQYC